MPIENPQYDVAISFLSQDEAIAAGINQKLSEGLNVFFFPKRQQELAGTNGLESMRTPFFEGSRLSVVLFREPWGKTPWTRVEETAIKEACLKHGWHRLFFIVLDSASTLPVWLPQSEIRFNYADYGLEQAVGAIKARVQQNGGHPMPLTALKRAEILRAEEQFRRDKSQMNTEKGIESILDSVAELCRQIEKLCEDINTQGFLRITCRCSDQSCSMTNGLVGFVVTWNQRYSNSLDHSSLTVAEYNGGLIFPDQMGHSGFVVLNPPELLHETRYSPDLSRAREYGWRQGSKPEVISSLSLAERCVIQFVELVDRKSKGKIISRR